MILQAIPVSQSPTTLIVGVIVAVGAFVSPFITAYMTNRNAARMKLADYARQDEIAQRLSDRQDLSERKAAEVADQAAEAARLLVASNHKQEEIAIVQGAKLDQIHTLVNSNLTAAMQDQFDARSATLVLLKALPNPSRDVLGQIEANEAKVAELAAQLDGRKKQTEEAARQLSVDLARKPA